MRIYKSNGYGTSSRSSMGVFDRLGTLLKSNINDLISKAEDPEKMLDQALDEMKKQLVEAKSRVAMAIADEKRLVRDLERHKKNAADWESKAMAAVRAERDDLAVKALNKKKEHEAIASQLEGQVDEQHQAVVGLKTALSAINEKIQEAQRKKTMLLARQKRAEAQKAVAQTLAAAHDPKALAPINKMNERIDRLEAEAAARLEVAAYSTGVLEDPLAEEFRMLEASTGAPQNDDLAALKKKMGLLEGGSETKALPETTSAADESDSAAAPGEKTVPQHLDPAED